LARQHLQRRINKLRADEQAAAGQPVQSVESIKLDPADYARLLQKLYERTFGAIGTNQAATSPSNTPSVVVKPPLETAHERVNVPSLPEINRRDFGEFVKGGERLMRHETALPTPVLAIAPTPVAPVPPSIAQTPPAPATAPSAPDEPQMEQRLLGKIRVTDDELRELAQKRARAVQSALLESSQIAPGRVFVLAPKPIDAAAPGEARVDFSLE
jgi:hypothetical protein